LYAGCPTGDTAAAICGTAAQDISAEAKANKLWLMKFLRGVRLHHARLLNYAAVLPLVQKEWDLSNSSAG